MARGRVLEDVLATEVWIPSDRPDRLCFTELDPVNPDARVHDEGDFKWVYIRDLWSIESDLKDLENKPDWLQGFMDEWTFFRENDSISSRYQGFWMPSNDYVILSHPYAMSIADEVHRLQSPYFYSTMSGGWVIKVDSTDLENYAELVDVYDLATSPQFEAVIEGRGNWKKDLQLQIEWAKEQGFAPREGVRSGREYKPWQKEAVVGLQTMPMLTDEVGLGKGGSFIGGCLTRSSWADNYAQDETPWPMILSTTSTLKHEIAQEILLWDDDITADDIQIMQGKKRTPLEPGKRYYILNHDILAPRIEDILEVQPRSFVADEAHAFKNITGAKRAKAALQLANDLRSRMNDPYIVMATGTPFDNAPVELWGILSILGLEEIIGQYAMDRLGKDTQINWYFNRKTMRYQSTKTKMTYHRAFEEYFCGAKWVGKSKKFYINRGATHIPELNALLTNKMIRRKKSDVIHPLPPINEHAVIMELTGEGKELYRVQEQEFEAWCLTQINEIAEAEGVSRAQALRILQSRLRTNRDMMQMTQLRKTLAYAKVEPTVEWIHRFMAGDPKAMGVDPDDPVEMAKIKNRRKLIVYVHHKEPRDMLVAHPELQQYGIVTILPNAEQDGESVQKAKRQFQNLDEDSPRLIICTMAAREGHTLTAAHDVFLMEIPFTASWIVQMVGRCWARLPHIHEANLHMAIVPKTDDVRSLHRVRVKAVTFRAVIDQEAGDEDVESVVREDFDDLEDMIQSVTANARRLGIVG